MVNRQTPRVDRVFRALADSTRREILFRVARADRTVGELAQPFRISAPAISRHLKILEEAGLLQRVRSGKHHRFHLNTEPLTDIRKTLDDLTAFWLQRLDELENFLDREKATTARRKS
ncbi:MAG TPA: metalloregulator ArsR/SmtB family transcription factor [Opitutus sp.]|nr:metalloregulator ArsR/SmtB family transcription factor [Opitutus sp.]